MVFIGEILLTSGMEDKMKNILKRAFWEHSDCSAEFYRQLENIELDNDDLCYLFRVKIRGKYLFGIVRAHSIKHASCLVTGKIAWAVKDLLN